MVTHSNSNSIDVNSTLSKTRLAGRGSQWVQKPCRRQPCGWSGHPRRTDLVRCAGQKQIPWCPRLGAEILISYKLNVEKAWSENRPKHQRRRTKIRNRRCTFTRTCGPNKKASAVTPNVYQEYVEIKCQLDATEVFISDLIACSTCFGHHYAHYQELKSIIQLLLRVVFCAVVFQVAGLVWS